MNQISSYILVAVVSVIGTLLFVNNGRLPPLGYTEHFAYHGSDYPRYGISQNPPVPLHESLRQFQVSAPHKMSRLNPLNWATGRQASPYISGESVRNQPVSAPTVRQLGSDCSSDPFSCGSGFYCCQQTCVKSVFVNVTFAADDMGELFVCQQTGYNPVASTPSINDVASISTWLPCAPTYLKATNTQFQGGASIAVIVNGFSFGSGLSLAVSSQTDFQGDFRPVVNFTELNGTPPFSKLISELKAFPVKDSVNSNAGVTNFLFVPPTC